MRNTVLQKKITFFVCAASLLLFASCTKVERTHYPDGGLESEIPYRFGRMHGKAVWYYEHGKPRMQAEYMKGRLQGECVRYYRNGKVESRGTYVRDTLEGVFEQYAEEGWLSERFLYKKGVKDGPYCCYHDGEQLQVQGAYADGQFDGEWLYYDFQGFLVGKAHFKRGKGVLEAYDEQDRVVRRVSYENSRKNGPESFFSANGCEYKTMIYQNDRLIQMLVYDTMECKQKTLR
ncbi:MAG: toxin-antitoxin system YwqK family antitoxin [Bacteroidales bacterium]|nr:toxin-antitoxin system YwqK family antitoxin [Bacteroidales bacterium]